MSSPGITEPCSTRSAPALPATSHAASARTSEVRVTQWIATPRPHRCAALDLCCEVGEVGIGGVVDDELHRPELEALRSGGSGERGTAGDDDALRQRPVGHGRGERREVLQSPNGVVSVTPVTPRLVRLRPRAPRSGAASDGRRARNQASARCRRPVGRPDASRSMPSSRAFVQVQRVDRRAVERPPRSRSGPAPASGGGGPADRGGHGRGRPPRSGGSPLPESSAGVRAPGPRRPALAAGHRRPAPRRGRPRRRSRRPPSRRGADGGRGAPG